MSVLFLGVLGKPYFGKRPASLYRLALNLCNRFQPASLLQKLKESAGANLVAVRRQHEAGTGNLVSFKQENTGWRW